MNADDVLASLIDELRDLENELNERGAADSKVAQIYYEAADRLGVILDKYTI